MAPEVISSCYTEKCDMWSLGVTVYLLLSGSFPFNGATQSEIFGKIRSCDYTFPSPQWDHVSQHAKDFLRKLLVSDPAKRMSAQESLQHPWMQQVADAPCSRQLSAEPLMLSDTFRRQTTSEYKAFMTQPKSKNLPVLLRTAMRTRSAAQDCQLVKL